MAFTVMLPADARNIIYSPIPGICFKPFQKPIDGVIVKQLFAFVTVGSEVCGVDKAYDMAEVHHLLC